MSNLLCFMIISLVIASRSQSCYGQNCLQCANPYICNSCPPQLQCCQPQCTICRDSNSCAQCTLEYFFNIGAQLCQLSNSCSQAQCVQCQNNVCNVCISGYAISEATYRCIKCPPQCLVCDHDGTCFSCISNYYQETPNKCQPCGLIACIQCLNPNICLSCQEGWAISNVSALCVPCTFHCKSCVLPSNCQVCKSGFYLTLGFKCKACASSCVNCYGTSTNCTVCTMDQFLQNGQCVYCFTAYPFCVACVLGANSQLSCLSCQRGMYANGNSCQNCSSKCQVCLNESTCQNCSIGYYLTSDFTCQPCSPNCSQCSNGTSCQTCAGYFYPINGSGLCVPCSPQCQVCTGSSCINCQNGFQSFNNICLPCTANCQTCPKSLSVCTLCLIGFYGKKTWLGETLCLPCPSYCVNCLDYANCIKCSPGDNLVNNSLCLPGQITNCYEYSNQEACILCQSGYYLSSNGTCAACSANCIVCNNALICQSCGDGFFLVNGTCSSCSLGCSKCLYYEGCLSCLAGFYLSSTYSCFICPVGCSECLSLQICLTCNYGFYLAASGLCQPCKYPCLSCYSSAQCSLCAPGYILSQLGICQECHEGCLKCYHKKSCQICSEGYALVIENGPIANFVCQACPNNCSLCHSVVNVHTNYSSVKCSHCAFGLLLLQDGSCLQCGSTAETQGCQSCNLQGRCSSCMAGFNLNGSGLCVNTSRQILRQENWGLAGACIGLGCLAMFLIIAVLYIKLSKRANLQQ